MRHVIRSDRLRNLRLGTTFNNRRRMIAWMEQMDLKNTKDLADLEAEIRKLKNSLEVRIIKKIKRT